MFVLIIGDIMRINLKMGYFWFFLLSMALTVLCFCSSVFAIEVNSAGGSLEPGGLLTITGIDFGSKKTASPIKVESFEWGDIGDAIDSGKDPIFPKWQKAGVGGSLINNTQAHSGLRSAFMELKPNNNVCAFYDSYISFVDSDQLYVSYWFYWDTVNAKPLSNGGAFFKLNRINGSNVPYSGNPSLGISLIPHYAIPETGYMDIWGYTDDHTGKNHHNLMRVPSKLTAVYGKWHRVEMWLKLSTPAGAGNGGIEYAIDSIPVEFIGKSGDGFPWEGITLSKGSTAKINVFTLLFGGCRFTNESYPLLWQDDIYIDNTRSRIEIGDASNWLDFTHREIQIPTVWSGSEIKIKVNQGSFDTLVDKYLFVVDTDGNISKGFSLSNVAVKKYDLVIKDFQGDDGLIVDR